MTPTNEGQSELRPCPFCGSIEIANHRSGYVYCMECEASGPIAYGEPNGAPWNRRTPDQSLAQKDAELAALRTQDAYDNEAIERMQREGARLEVEAAQKDVRITELEAESEGAYEAIHDANGSTAEGGLALAIKRMAEEHDGKLDDAKARIAELEAKLAAATGERDEAKRTERTFRESYVRLEKMHRDISAKYHNKLTDEAEAAPLDHALDEANAAKIAELQTALAAETARGEKLREALEGMLESFEILDKQCVERFENQTMQGVVRGAFLHEPKRAQDALALTPSDALAERLKGAFVDGYSTGIWDEKMEENNPEGAFADSQTFKSLGGAK